MRKTLRKSEVKELLDKFSGYGLEYSKKDNFILDDNVLLINNEPCFFYHEKRLVPHLKLLLRNNFLKKITVDMGAIRFMVNGADVMRPGITEIEESIRKDDLVSVVDETHNKPIAVGSAMFDAEEMKQKDNGKMVKNIHYVGDSVWNI